MGRATVLDLARVHTESVIQIPIRNARQLELIGDLIRAGGQGRGHAGSLLPAGGVRIQDTGFVCVSLLDQERLPVQFRAPNSQREM